LIIARLAGGDRNIVARIGGDVPLKVGEQCRLNLDAAAAHVFSEDGNALDV
jgi:hypothetical protein